MITLSNISKKIQLNKLMALIMSLFILMIPFSAYAEITGPDAFEEIEWEQVLEQDLETGIVQSIVATEDYIICICNVADDATVSDIIYAYYRNDTDENGDPVEPYSLAKRVENHEWEHGNGMAYNPDTHEIYVALYTNTITDNKGCLYIMDPDTLEYKGKIKVSDDYNILGIDYVSDTDQYVIQTNVDGQYSIKVLDNTFKEVDDFGEFESVNIGTNYQDLTVSEDYILNFPLVMNLGIGDYLNVFSLSQKSLLSQTATDFQITTDTSNEPESLTVIGDGEFLAVVNLYDTEVFRLYKATVPFNYHVTVTAENGTVSKKELSVLRGNSATIQFSPDEKYEFSSLTLDGREQTMGENATTFTIPNINADHTVKVTFTEIPFPWRQVLTIAGICAAALILLIMIIVMAVRHSRKKRKSVELKRLQEKRRIREEKLQIDSDKLDAIESEIGLDPVSEITAATAAEVTAPVRSDTVDLSVDTQTVTAVTDTHIPADKENTSDHPIPQETIYIPLENIDEDDEAFAARIAQSFSKYQSPVQVLAKKKAEDEAREKAEIERKEKAAAEAKALKLERLKAEEAARRKVFEDSAKEKARREADAKKKALAAKAAEAKAAEEEKARKAAELQAQLEAKMKAFEEALAKADRIEAETKSKHGNNIETQKVEIEVKTTHRVKKNK